MQKAETELANVMADIRRGTWRPPEPITVGLPPEPETFREFARRWFHECEDGLSQRTRDDYAWRLSKHLLPFFGEHPLRSITVAEIDRYRAVKRREGVLCPESINKTLTLLGRVLDVALERDDRNPMRINPIRRKEKVPASRPIYLDSAEQIAALLDAAGELDRETSRTAGRRALVATLVMAGLRVGEACALRWRDVDLANERLLVRSSKTDAGVREVRLLPALRAELVAHVPADAITAPDTLVFRTRTGRPRDKDNVRSRVLAPVLKGADELLAARGHVPLPRGVTTHKLRHTAASVWAALGLHPTDIQAQLGHSNAAFSMTVYTHSMRRDPGSRERLLAWTP